MPDHSRRRLLQGLAAAFSLPSAGIPAEGLATGAGVGGSRSGARRVVVIGAGAFGAWTALSLAQAGAAVTLVDAWGPGNARASSGGESRVIRAIYGADRLYSQMVAEAFPLWEALAAATGEALYTPTGALWMLRSEDDRYTRAALPILEELGFPVSQPSLAEAARRWPQIRFDGVRSVLLEERAGMLAARRSCVLLRDEFLALGGRYRTARVEAPGALEGHLDACRLAGGERLEADDFVFACGPWLGGLFPELLTITPTRQDVLYFGPPAGATAYGPKALPVWVDFGERVIYGLPDAHGRGFKLADDTRGETVDPDTLERIPNEAAIAAARRFLGERFPELAKAPVLESRVCQYENSLDGHLIVDRHPAAGNVWLAGGGSGHGFKLAPAVGGRLAAAVLGGGELPPLFSLARFSPAGRGGDSPEKTQFEG